MSDNSCSGCTVKFILNFFFVSTLILFLQIEHAEIILQYLSLDTDYIKSDTEAQETVKSLPIFEDVDGSYKVDGVNGIVLSHTNSDRNCVGHCVS